MAWIFWCFPWKVTRRNNNQNPWWNLPKHTLWWSVGRGNGGSHTSSNSSEVPDFTVLVCQTKYPNDLAISCREKCWIPENSVFWRAETGQKAGYRVSVRKTDVMVVAMVYGHSVHEWCSTLRLRNDLSIHYNSRYQLSKTYRVYCLHFCPESTPVENFFCV